jgi:hypothetical protein
MGRYVTVLLAGCLLGFLSEPVAGEELRPYQLPSQRQTARPEPERIIRQEHPMDPQGGEEFRRRIENLSPDERARFEEGIRERLRQAVREGRMEEARYYENLCAILQQVGR